MRRRVAFGLVAALAAQSVGWAQVSPPPTPPARASTADSAIHIGAPPPKRPRAEAARFAEDLKIHKQLVDANSPAELAKLQDKLEAVVARAPARFPLFEVHDNGVVVRAPGDMEAGVAGMMLALAAANQAPEPKRAKRTDVSFEPNVYGDAAFMRARIAENVDDDAAALKWLDAGLTFQPDNPTLVIQRGRILSQLNRKAEAIEALENWSEANSLLLAALGEDGARLHSQRGMLLNELSRPDDAIEAYRAALQIRPEDRAAKTQIAYIARAQGKPDPEFDSVIPAPRTAAEKAQLDRDLATFNGLVLRRREDIPAATPQLQQIVANAPKRFWLVDARDGQMVVRKDLPEPVLRRLGGSIGVASLSPGNTRVNIDGEPNVYGDAAMLLGAMAVETQDYAGALKWLDAGVAFQPDNPDLVTERGLALMKLSRLDEALAGYDAWLRDHKDLHRLDPKDTARVHRGRGGVLIEMSRLDDAEAAFKASQEFDPDNPTADNELIYIAGLRKGSKPTTTTIISNDDGAPR